MTTSRSYLSLIRGISEELDSENSRGLGWLAAIPSSLSGCCHCRCASSSLELLQQMQARGVYSQHNLAPLIEMLREIGRQDLATKCEPFQLPSPVQSDSKLNRAQQASPPSLYNSSSPPLHDSYEELSSPPATPVSLHRHNPLSGSTGKLYRLGQRVASKLCKRPLAVTGSYDEGLDSFYIVDHKDLADYPGHTSSIRGCALPHQPPKRGKSWTAGGEVSLSSSPTHSCNHTPFMGGLPTCSWPLKRSDFISPIFHHNNKAFEKKFQVRAGGKESGCVLTFVLKLYPNGVNWDQDSSASLHVEVVIPHSTQTSSILYFGASVVEDRTTSRHVLTQRRRICKLREEREFLFDGFLSHEVVKTSQAKLLYVLFHVELSYLLGEDWVCVGAEHSLGHLEDPRNLWGQGGH